MEMQQLNQTLEDFQNSLQIHKSILDNVLNGSEHEAVSAAYNRMKELEQLNQCVVLERGDLQAKCLVLEQINAECSKNEEEI